MPVNPNSGDVHHSVITVEAGVPPTQVNVGAGNLAGSIYLLEVPREVHNCRQGTDCQ